MDMDNVRNYVRLCGTLSEKPRFSHRARGEDFFTFPLEIMRLSGAYDTVNVIVRKKLLDTLEVREGRLCVTGELRSFNNRTGDGAKLVISVFAREICFTNDDDENIIMLSGTVCKPPKLRTTPLGRDICDIMLAVNRSCGRSDYLPCICWGTKAREAAQWSVGDKLALSGRVQSRRYKKLIGDEFSERTAFEVSAAEIGLL